MSLALHALQCRPRQGHKLSLMLIMASFMALFVNGFSFFSWNIPGSNHNQRSPQRFTSTSDATSYREYYQQHDHSSKQHGSQPNVFRYTLGLTPYKPTRSEELVSQYRMGHPNTRHLVDFEPSLVKSMSLFPSNRTGNNNKRFTPKADMNSTGHNQNNYTGISNDNNSSLAMDPVIVIEDDSITIGSQTSSLAGTNNESSKDDDTTNRTSSSHPSVPWYKHMDPSTYFHFQPYQPKLNNSTKANNGLGSHNKTTTTKGPMAIDLQKLLQHKDPTDLLTVQDLQSILGIDIQHSMPSRAKSSSRPGMIEAADTTTKTTNYATTTSSTTTAFPQPTLLSNQAITRGTTVAGGILGLLVGLSVYSNLWLAGAISGSLYAHDVVTTQLSSTADKNNNSILNRIILDFGLRLARTYLRIKDTAVTVFFMYKTGQLSLQYYRQYAKLDERFAIQNKIDAWNARFVQGKIAFDHWEKENEVGRKVLATLRTFWLVEEQSFKKKQRQLELQQRERISRYRLIQVIYDAVYWTGRWMGEFWNRLAKIITNDDESFREFLSGCWDLQERPLSTRLSAAMVLVVLVNFVGTLFMNSPMTLSAVALLLGVFFPTWLSRGVEQCQAVWEETRALGRKEKSEEIIPKPRRVYNFWPKVDSTKYHFYVTKQGKKQYYRVGKPWFQITPTKEANDEHSFWRPWKTNNSAKKSGWWI